MPAFVQSRRERRRARVRQGRRPKGPRRVERQYERALVALNRRMVAEVNRTIRPYLAHAARVERQDAEIPTATFGVDFGSLRIRVMQMVREAAVSPIVDRWGRAIVTWNTREMRRVLRFDLEDETAEIQALLQSMRTENVRLITSIADRLLGDVFRVVTESVINGTRVETLAKRIQERYGVSESRARLIARDQTLKANSNLTQTRQREAGVSRYIWSSSRDERVRDMHADLDGTVQSWDDPPVTNEQGETNHPGEDYQCRCVAVPVLEGDPSR